MTGKKDKGLFDELYALTKETSKMLKKPIVKRQIKRRLTAAFDDAESNKINAESELQDMRSDFENFDVNDILEKKLIIVDNTKLQSMIESEYETLFGKVMPKSD